MFGTTPESERTGENGPALLGTEQTISNPHLFRTDEVLKEEQQMISLGRGRIFLIFKEEALCLIKLVRASQLNEPTRTGTDAEDVKHRTFKTCDVAPIGTADPEPELLSGADKRHF